MGAQEGSNALVVQGEAGPPPDADRSWSGAIDLLAVGSVLEGDISIPGEWE